MLIRRFEVDDYDVVRGLWEATPWVTPVTRREAVAKLERDPDLFVVAEDGGTVVGTALGSWDGRRGWIARVAVRADRRRRGIAHALVDDVERRLRDLGAAKVNLLVLADNGEGRRFWEDAGYVVFDGIVLASKRLDGAPTDAPGC